MASALLDIVFEAKADSSKERNNCRETLKLDASNAVVIR
jgi:hypothetical protein